MCETIGVGEICGVNRDAAAEDGDAAAAAAGADWGLIAVSEISARRADSAVTEFYARAYVADDRGFAGSGREEDVGRVDGHRLAAGIERTAQVNSDTCRRAVAGDRKIAGLELQIGAAEIDPASVCNRAGEADGQALEQVSARCPLGIDAGGSDVGEIRRSSRGETSAGVDAELQSGGRAIDRDRARGDGSAGIDKYR